MGLFFESFRYSEKSKRSYCLVFLTSAVANKPSIPSRKMFLILAKKCLKDNRKQMQIRNLLMYHRIPSIRFSFPSILMLFSSLLSISFLSTCIIMPFLPEERFSRKGFLLSSFRRRDETLLSTKVNASHEKDNSQNKLISRVLTLLPLVSLQTPSTFCRIFELGLVWVHLSFYFCKKKKC